MTIYTSITQLSCVLSMAGALLVILTWAHPAANRQKHGRILLFWLSIADFMTALFYFLQSCIWNHQTTFCKFCGLMDIFFPVASFIWTDFIAFYLFLVVQNRSSKAPFNWKRLLVSFHIIAWSVSALSLLLVLLFGHAGRSSDDGSDDQDSLTGGWCWITAKNGTQRFIWELIGGKLIEWISGLIVVPALYITVAYRLYQIDQRQIKLQRNTEIMSPMTHVSSFRRSTNLRNTNNDETMNPPITTDDLDQDNISDRRSVVSQPFPTEPQRMTSMDSAWSGTSQSMRQSFEQDEANGAAFHGASLSKRGGDDGISVHGLSISHTNQQNARLHTPQSKKNTNRNFFSQFYIKLAVLPVVFFFIRCWSSIRIILDFAGSPAAKSPFLHGMQSFFDPSQGFFNAIIFVLFSTEDRQSLYLLLKQLATTYYERICSCCGCSSPNTSTPPREDVQGGTNGNSVGQVKAPGVNTLRDALISPQRQRENSTIDIQDLEEDFECEEYDANRLSDFSFDSRAVDEPMF